MNSITYTVPFCVCHAKYISAMRVKYFEPTIWQTKYSYSTTAYCQNKGLIVILF